MSSTFKCISPQYAVDEDAGIAVEITGPYSLRYADNNYEATLATEPLKEGDHYKICLYLSDLQQWQVPAEQDISDNEKQTIETRIKNAMRALGVAVEIA